MIPAPIARYIHGVVREDIERRTANHEHVIFSEVTRAPQPVVNRSYPPDAALPTVPPLMLMRLPRLPDNLQYRFYGRHLLLLEGDALISRRGEIVDSGVITRREILESSE